MWGSIRRNFDRDMDGATGLPLPPAPPSDPDPAWLIRPFGLKVVPGRGLEDTRGEVWDQGRRPKQERRTSGLCERRHHERHRPRRAI